MPLNQHYRPILTVCELLLRDSALDEEIGEKTSISFLINMNKLFEEFVGNLLEKRLYEYQVELQKTEHPEKSGEGLIIKLDIMISRNGIPLFIIDTKYQQMSGIPEASHGLRHRRSNQDSRYITQISANKHKPQYLNYYSL